MAQVFWSTLLERSVQEQAVIPLLAVAGRAANQGYSLLATGYQRTDTARNYLIDVFLKNTTDPDDCLVMLDCDHAHPVDIVERLAAHNVGVVGALAFRRGEPFDPCFFVRTPDGKLAHLLEWRGLMRGAVVGTGAVAIRRWVFDKLTEAGFGWPFFRYAYTDEETLRASGFQSEDVYFALNCEKAGIPHHCDTTLVTPHLITSAVDDETWKRWVTAHKDQIQSEIAQVHISEVEYHADPV
jgi:hypothetical protein